MLILDLVLSLESGKEGCIKWETTFCMAGHLYSFQHSANSSLSWPNTKCAAQETLMVVVLRSWAYLPHRLQLACF
jgi:hypothetical protein